GHRLRIYPNPADQYVDIYPGLTDDRSETYVIELYDHTGRPIRRIVSGDEVYTLHRNDLPAGIYYIAVRYADGSHSGGKIVFQ
ncbi:MAG: T9SS type A sorting domain-containing protein, partial [Bacteroidetes bacterium]|nr:T9SS type A sorting domain-containing protein [Bacteroidota bacterium]